MIPLQTLGVGQRATIRYIAGPDIQRLREVGFAVGTEVEVISGGSPCVIRVGDQRLAVRCDELTSILAAPILVEPGPRMYEERAARLGLAKET